MEKAEQKSEIVAPSSSSNEAAPPPFPPEEVGLDAYELDDEVHDPKSVPKSSDHFSRVPEIIYDTFAPSKDSTPPPAETDLTSPAIKSDQAATSVQSKRKSLLVKPALHPRTTSMMHPASHHTKNMKAIPVISEEIPAYDDIAFQKTTKTLNTSSQNALQALGTYESVVVHQTSASETKPLGQASNTSQQNSLQALRIYESVVVHQTSASETKPLEQASNTSQQNSLQALGTYESVVVHQTSTSETKPLGQTKTLGPESTYDDITVHQVQNATQGASKLKLNKKKHVNTRKTKPDITANPPHKRPDRKSNSPKGHMVDPASRVSSVLYGDVKAPQKDAEEMEKDVILPPLLKFPSKPAPRLFPRTASMAVGGRNPLSSNSTSSVTMSDQDTQPDTVSTEQNSINDSSSHATNSNKDNQTNSVCAEQTLKNGSASNKTQADSVTPENISYDGVDSTRTEQISSNESTSQTQLDVTSTSEQITSKDSASSETHLDSVVAEQGAQGALTDSTSSNKLDSEQASGKDSSTNSVQPDFARMDFTFTEKEIQPDSISAEDIYDDIIVYKMRKSATHKPKLLPKPAHLQFMHIDKRRLQPKNLPPSIISSATTIPSTTTEAEDDDVYDDIIITALRKQKFTSFEDIYDDIIIKRMQKSKPDVPQKPTNIHSHPKVAEIRRQRKLKRLEAIEEIYDLDPPEPTLTDELGEFEEIYIDPGDISGSDGSGEEGDTSKQKATGGTGSHVATEENPTQEEGGPTSRTSLEDGSEEETYEELVIYEELRSNEEEGYQDIEKARVEALGLPENPRNRSTRIVKGPKRRKLKKTIKRRSLHLTEGRTQHNGSGSPPELLAQNGTSPLLSEKLSEAIENPDAQNPDPPDTKQASSNEEGEEEEEEEKPHDGYMTHKKAREVLDMLLEAQNVKKIAHIGKSLTLPAETSTAIEPIPVCEDSDIEDEVDLVLPPEVKEYQQAGILSAKSAYDIAAEIKFLTESAPKEPPPLPGLQRGRSKPVSNRDSMLRSRRNAALKRTQTMPNMKT